MEKKTIRKSVEVNAPGADVWAVLLNDNFTRIWYGEFSEGAYAETDWQQGSKVVFKDESGSGMVGKVVVNQPEEILSVEYQGLLMAGQEDYESADAQAVKGGRETYRLSDNGGRTLLAIEADMGEAFFDDMSVAWDRALQKIKELAEKSFVEK
jgi:uncharacterized protein YndB with AHSA1/START domain